jgi:hypothetical protein
MTSYGVRTKKTARVDLKDALEKVPYHNFVSMPGDMPKAM